MLIISHSQTDECLNKNDKSDAFTCIQLFEKKITLLSGLEEKEIKFPFPFETVFFSFFLSKLQLNVIQ